MQNAGHMRPAFDLLFRTLRSGCVSRAVQPFNLFFQSQFLLFQFGYMKVVAAGVMNLTVDLLFQSPVAITKFGNMRLQSHLVSSFR